jgi:hypothetical protein
LIPYNPSPTESTAPTKIAASETFYLCNKTAFLTSYTYKNPNLDRANNSPYFVEKCIITGKSAFKLGSIGKSANFLNLVSPVGGAITSVI